MVEKEVMCKRELRNGLKMEEYEEVSVYVLHNEIRWDSRFESPSFCKYCSQTTAPTKEYSG